MTDFVWLGMLGGQAAAHNINRTPVTCDMDVFHSQNTGSAAGELYLWRYGQQRSVAAYTPLPASMRDPLPSASSLSLTFSPAHKSLSTALSLPYWGQATSVSAHACKTVAMHAIPAQYKKHACNGSCGGGRLCCPSCYAVIGIRLHVGGPHWPDVLALFKQSRSLNPADVYFCACRCGSASVGSGLRRSEKVGW